MVVEAQKMFGEKSMTGLGVRSLELRTQERGTT